MKKRSVIAFVVLAMILSSVLSGLLVGCSGSREEPTAKEQKRVGLVQLAEHPPLDAMGESILQ